VITTFIENSVSVFLRIKLLKSDGSLLSSAESNTVGCVNNLLHYIFSSLSVSLNGKPVTLHETKLTLQDLPCKAAELQF